MEDKSKNNLDNELSYVTKSARNESEKISVNGGNKLATTSGTSVSTGSLTYYLNESTPYFQDGFTLEELPIYAAFLAVTLISATTLNSICGKVADPKAIASAILAGLSTGLAPASIIIALFFTGLGDLITAGAFSLLGMLGGILYIRRGKKVHQPCGKKLNCDTWICPNCKRFINPTYDFRSKDMWDIFDICQYLDIGGRRMNVLQAIAYIDHAGLLSKGTKRPETPALWSPKLIVENANDDNKLNEFYDEWQEFTNSKPYQDCSGEFDCILREWNTMKVEKAAR